MIPEIKIFFWEISLNKILILYVRSISLHIVSSEVLSQTILLFNQPG